MGVPTTRTPVRIARGDIANLSTAEALASLQEGEIAFATDEGKLYVKQGSTLTSISASSQAAPTPSNVTATPAFAAGSGTQSDPYQITSLGAPFSGAEAQSAQDITITGTPGDFVIFTDASPTVSGSRFANQVVGNVDSGGTFVFKLKYKDSPGTTVDNTTYNGITKIGSVYFSWVVVQSNMTVLSEVSATTIAFDSLGVGGIATATEGTVTGGTSGYTYATRWQRSFNGTNGWFDIGSTGTTYNIQSADSGYYIRAVTTGTDSTPSNQGGPLTLDIMSASSSQINTAGVANIGSFVLTEDNTSGARYTSKTFSAVANLNPDGVPVSTKALKVKLDGSFSTFPSTSNISGKSSTDSLGSNINASTLSYQGSGGGSTSQPYDWTQHYVTGTGGHAFVTFACQYSSGQNLSMFKSTYGLDSGTNPGDGGAVSPSNSPSISTGRRYTDSSMGTIYNFYQNSGGGNSSCQVHFSEVYKNDTLLHHHSQGKWLFLEDSLTVSNGIWKPINASNTAQEATAAQYMMGMTDDRQYAVNCSAVNTTSATVHIMEGDICDYSATVTTTDLTITWSQWAPSGAGTNGVEIGGFFGHGSKISMPVRFYNGSAYTHYMFTCDFSVNDGSDKSHWVVTLGPVPTSEDFRLYRTAVDSSTNKIIVAWGTDGNYQYISTNNGSSYSTFNISPGNGWSLSNIQSFCFSRGRLLAMCRGTNNNLYGNGNPRWFIVMSSNNGSNWTPSIQHSGEIAAYGQYRNVTMELMSRQGMRNFKNGGGKLIINGGYYYYSTQVYRQRQLFWFDDFDSVTFTDSTNLGNNSFRNGDKVRQGSSTAHISAISGSTANLLSVNGTFVTGSPVENTVNYFGGSISTMYGVINSAGTVTDLTSTEPGFVNLGYLTDNTITFPATLPSGNTPDAELASGTSITVSAEFANSQGTVSGTTNTVTPS